VAEDVPVGPVGSVRPPPPPPPGHPHWHNRPTEGSTFGGGSPYRGGLGAPPSAAAPAPAMRAEALQDSVGSGAVAMSRETKRMKEADRPADGGAVKVASGRTFLLQGGAWVQAGLKADARRLRVKFMSAAWSELLKRAPQLKGALALGERVVLEVAPGRVVEVGPEGEEKAEALSGFLR